MIIPWFPHSLFRMPHLFKSPLLMRTLCILGIVPLDNRRQIPVTRHYLSTFFDVFLKGAPIATRTGERDYPEVEYVHF